MIKIYKKFDKSREITVLNNLNCRVVLSIKNGATSSRSKPGKPSKKGM